MIIIIMIIIIMIIMIIIIIPTVAGVPGSIHKGLIKGLKVLEIGGQLERLSRQQIY